MPAIKRWKSDGHIDTRNQSRLVFASRLVKKYDVIDARRSDCTILRRTPIHSCLTGCVACFMGSLLCGVPEPTECYIYEINNKHSSKYSKSMEMMEHTSPQRTDFHHQLQLYITTTLHQSLL